MRLAWESARNEVNLLNTCPLKNRIACNVLDTAKADGFGEVPVIDFAGEWFDFGVGDGANDL